MMRKGNNSVNCLWGGVKPAETGCGDLQAVGRKTMNICYLYIAKLLIILYTSIMNLLKIMYQLTISRQYLDR